jgi:homoserine dehydrogenase
VYPTLVPNNKLIAQVDGVMNAVMVKSDALGTSLYYGPGAGDEATASAVIADLNDIINNQTSNHTLGWKSQQKIKVVDNNSIHSEFFLRLLVTDVKGVLAKVTGIFNDHNVSTKTVMSIKEKIEASEFNQANVQIIHIELLD